MDERGDYEVCASGDMSQSEKLSVLVVENNPVHRQIMSVIFEALGCSVTLASDGLEALDATRHGTFDVVMMDRHMPRCDGDCAAFMIRTTPGPSQTAAIVCCSTDLPTEEFELLYDEVLAKPLTSAATANLLLRVQRRPLTPSKSAKAFA